MGRRAPRTRRAGFTLTEILVVLGLMLLLAALAAAVGYSGLIGSQKVVGGADRASGWLLIAKQQAKRDGRPNGVRFIGTPDPANPSAVYFREAQYVSAPDPWVPNPNKVPTGPRLAFSYEYEPVPPATVVDTSQPNQPLTYRKNVFFVSDNPADIDELIARVEPGDMLIIPQFGESYYVDGIDAPRPEPASSVTPPYRILVEGQTKTPESPRQFRRVRLRSTVGVPGQGFPDVIAGGTQYQNPPPATGKLTVFTTVDFAFQGKARPIIGEPVLQMTNEIAIDYRSPGPTGHKDLSSPPGPTPPYNPQTTTGVAPTLWQSFPPAPAADQVGRPVLDADGKCAFDILFSPSGQVLDNPLSVICLWVRKPENVAHPRIGLNNTDPNECDNPREYNSAGDQALVVVSTRTGLISTQPINPPAGGGVHVDPYKFAKDGQNNGL